LLYGLGLAREFTPMLVVWVVYLTDYRDLSLAQVGMMEGLFWVVKLGLEVPSGAFADRFGRRATFLTGIGCEGAGTLIFAFAGDFTLLVLSYVIWSAGLAFRSGNDEAYLYDTLKAGDRTNEYSDRVAVYWALSTASLFAGSLLGGLLAEVTNLQIAIFASLAPFVLAVPIMLSMQEPPWREHLVERLTITETLHRGVTEVWRNRPLRNIVLMEVALTGCFPAFFLLGQPFLRSHDVPLGLFGVLMVPVLLGRTVAGLSSGRVTRRIGLPAVLAIALTGAVGGLVLLAVVDHVAAFVGLGIALGAVALALPAIGAYINERTDSHVRATVLSLAPMGSSLAMASLSMAAGLIGDESLRLAFGLLAATILVTAGACLLAWRAAHGASLPVVLEPEAV
jgi:MFS family permease